MKFKCKEKCKYADKDGACHLECVESKKVLCVECKKPIHIKEFSAIDRKGLYHDKCIVKRLSRKRNA